MKKISPGGRRVERKKEQQIENRGWTSVAEHFT
jgi:hypothetical protein